MDYLVTRQGHQKLLNERKQILEEIEKVKLRMGEAGEGGDWHENNFLEFAEEQMHYLRSKLMITNNHIKSAKILSDFAKDDSKIMFGSSVDLEINGKKRTFKILGEMESDLSKRMISYMSPVGKSILGKKVGDEVEAQLPKGVLKIKIIGLNAGHD